MATDPLIATHRRQTGALLHRTCARRAMRLRACMTAHLNMPARRMMAMLPARQDTADGATSGKRNMQERRIQDINKTAEHARIALIMAQQADTAPLPEQSARRAVTASEPAAMETAPAITPARRTEVLPATETGPAPETETALARVTETVIVGKARQTGKSQQGKRRSVNESSPG